MLELTFVVLISDYQWQVLWLALVMETVVLWIFWPSLGLEEHDIFIFTLQKGGG